MPAPITSPASPEAPDTAKRRQIIVGAREVFLQHGFDGASMSDIVAASGVSKATLYAYFESKEKLFSALIFEERRSSAESVFTLDGATGEPRDVLRKLGLSFMDMMTRPGIVQLLRVVIAASAKFPQIGEIFYEAGPKFGKDKLTRYIAGQVAAGTMVADDAEGAAHQFMEMCKAGITLPMLLGVKKDCPVEERTAVVDRAVSVFMTAYAAPR